MKTNVLHNQTIFDIALQHTGSIESVFDILVLNNKENLPIIEGEELTINQVLSQKMVDYYKAKGIAIASLDKNFLIQFANDFDDDDFDEEDLD